MHRSNRFGKQKRTSRFPPTGRSSPPTASASSRIPVSTRRRSPVSTTGHPPVRTSNHVPASTISPPTASTSRRPPVSADNRLAVHTSSHPQAGKSKPTPVGTNNLQPAATNNFPPAATDSLPPAGEDCPPPDDEVPGKSRGACEQKVWKAKKESHKRFTAGSWRDNAGEGTQTARWRGSKVWEGRGASPPGALPLHKSSPPEVAPAQSSSLAESSTSPHEPSLLNGSSPPGGSPTVKPPLQESSSPPRPSLQDFSWKDESSPPKNSSPVESSSLERSQPSQALSNEASLRSSILPRASPSSPPSPYLLPPPVLPHQGPPMIQGLPALPNQSPRRVYEELIQMFSRVWYHPGMSAYLPRLTQISVEEWQHLWNTKPPTRYVPTLAELSEQERDAVRECPLAGKCRAEMLYGPLLPSPDTVGWFWGPLFELMIYVWCGRIRIPIVMEEGQLYHWLSPWVKIPMIRMHWEWIG